MAGHGIWRAAVWGLLLTVVVVVVLGLVLARNGLSARSGLSAFEDRILYRTRKAAVAAAAGDRDNPHAGGWRDAVHHFQNECAVCHGPAGRGDGEIGSLVYPPAADLTLERTQSLSDGELHHIIAEGIRFTAMPGMTGHDSDEEIWQLVALVRQLPSLSPEELDAMTRESAAASTSGTHEHER